LLQKSRLAGTGTRNQADHRKVGLPETLSELSRQQIVVLQDVLSDYG
jgi:hypothetical protein